MDQILDENFQKPQGEIIYGGFWPRLGALFIDGLIVGIPTFAITYFNITTWKSIPLLIVMSLITIVYKPYFEFQYGATPGKMALNLKVVNLEFEKADLAAILLRNIFTIGLSLLSLVLAVGIFLQPEFQGITGYMDYLKLAAQDKTRNYPAWISSPIYLAEFICLVSDKKKRSLHDRIGKTYVIVKAP